MMATEKKYPSDTAERFQLRLPDGLRERIAANAKRNKRSMNAEIVERLESAYPPPPNLDETVADIEEQIKFLRRLPGASSLQILADSLDFLINDIARTPSVKPEDREKAKEFVEQRGVFIRAPGYTPDDK